MMTSNVMVWIRERLGGATEVTASTKVEVSSFAEDSRMESCMTSKGVAPTRWRAGTIASAMAVMACMWAVTPVSAGGADCVVADNGTGTVTLPPEGCAYLSPTEFHMIVDGLPPGTEIILEPIHRNFLCKQGSLPSEFCENPGGNLGGFIETFDSDVQFQATGTGALAGFNRIIDIPNVFCETHTGPRTPGDPVQTFDNEMVFLQGQLFGDPDFDQLLITAGTNNGLPSSGQTTLTQLGPPGSDFQVDSFFDIEYRIDFMGAPGGALGGMGGSTTGIVRVEAFGDPVICPLPPTEDWCAGLQTTQCVTGTDSDLCLPELVIVNQPGDIFVELCNCFDGETCGPVSITPDGELFRCPGECPAGAGQCEIHIDGNPTGQPDIPVSAVPPGSTVTCECGPGTDVCEPTPDGLACTNAVCPDPTAEQCQPKCANFNPLTGETKVTECDCVGFDDCHVVVGTAGTDPFCQGACPVNTVCEENLVTLPDGTVDICCDCVPVVQGACCVQLSCFITTAADCDAQSGSYQGDNTVCGPLEACCLADGSCADTPRACCIDFGGMPQGPGTTCADTVCGPNDCQPTADQQDCEPFICPDDPNGIVQDCQKKCIERDLDTGAIYVTDCECTGFDECHAELLTPGGPGTAGGVAGGPGADPCIVADNGTGTVTLPPAGCAYLSAEEVHMIIDGLPAGTTIELEPIHKDFICAKGAQSCSLPIPPGDCETTGGDLGGNLDCFDSILELQVTGNGPGLPPGYSRFLTVPLFTEVHTGPRTPGDAVQDFDNQMFRIEGELFGDPDFCTLRIRGGVDNGLASSGHTTLTELPSGDFYVDSFFDITYQIEFQGCPGSPLDGYAGTTEATIRMQTGGKPVCVGQCPPGEDCLETTVLNHVCEGGVNDGQPCDVAADCPNGFCSTRVSTCCDCLPVEEACCLPDGSCAVLPPADCAGLQGTPQGPGAVCGGALEACCITDADGNVFCQDVDPLCCVNVYGGVPGGAGSSCSSETGSCCFDADGDGIEESCAVMNQFCCEAQNGTFTAGGVCQGDADNNGIDDACEEPDFCPLPNAPFVPICEQNLSQCQDGDDTQRCLPRLLIAQNNGQIFPELCECFNQADECGPVSVRDVPGTPFFELSCEGICPPGEDCLIHLNGQSAGTPVITSDVIGAGTAVTCECDSGCPVADQPQAENKLGQACVTDADCSNLSVCRNGGCYVPKNKYISVRPGNIGQVVGLRVTMTQNNLFPALVGSQWWVQPHVATDPPEVYRLGCTKHYQDWATAPVVIQIADIHITTDAEYAVQALTEGCDQTDPNNFSPPILLPTVRLWGDCCGSSVAGVIQPPDGFVNFTDIQAAILGFQNAVNAPNDSWVDIDPNFPNAIVNLADVFRFVQAFQGAPYPYAGPVPCP